MTRRKDAIKRPDKRIGATLETLAFLFDVSTPTVMKAVERGSLQPSTGLFGVKLYHVASVEKAIFGAGSDHVSADNENEPSAADPIQEAVDRYAEEAATTKKRRRADAA